MFVPFGFFISYYLKAEKVPIPFFLTFIASISIEVVQMAIGRVFDVDDILLNLMGGIFGFLIYDFLRKISEKVPKVFHSRWFLDIGAILALIVLFILLIYWWRKNE